MNVHVELPIGLQIYRVCYVLNYVCSRATGIDKSVSVDDPFAIHDWNGNDLQNWQKIAG